jgi:hypothetical protein
MLAAMFLILQSARPSGLSRWRGAQASSRALCLLGLLLVALPCHAQDIEPRRWSHLPLDTNFLGVGYAYTSGDIFLNPVLQIEDGKCDLDTYALNSSITSPRACGSVPALAISLVVNPPLTAHPRMTAKATSAGRFPWVSRSPATSA